MKRSVLKTMLVRHEGLKKAPYRDSAGKLTIGVGRNLDDRGVLDCEVALMLDNDIDEARKACLRIFPGFDGIDDNRQHALLDMAFNLGATRLAKFTKMIAAVQARDWKTAAKEMADSEWAKQVGDRALELEQLILVDP